MSNTYYITEEGLKKLKLELKTKSTQKRQELRDSLEAMKKAGDLSENEGYSLTKEQIQLNEDRITELEALISSAVISKINTLKIQVGSTVELAGIDIKRYQLVSAEEANPIEGRISFSSPLGEQLLNKTINETIEFTNPKGEVNSYKIVKIS